MTALQDQLRGIADEIRADIKLARIEEDNERRHYFRGELQGILAALDLIEESAELHAEPIG